MAGIDEVLKRLVTDAEFRAALEADPAGALSGYMLYDEDLEVLASALTSDTGASAGVVERTGKITLAGLRAAFEGVLDDQRPRGAAPDAPYVPARLANPEGGSNGIVLDEQAGTEHADSGGNPEFTLERGSDAPSTDPGST